MDGESILDLPVSITHGEIQEEEEDVRALKETQIHGQVDVPFVVSKLIF